MVSLAPLSIGVRYNDISKEEYQEWKRGVIHDVLEVILRPLTAHMDEGINMLCPDGNRRYIVPVLAQYLADYEEQRLLGSILQGCCPKCVIPAFKKPSSNGDALIAPSAEQLEQDDDDFYVEGQSDAAYGPRDEYEARRLRLLYREEPKTLRTFGYHSTMPFTERHIHSSIYDCLAPDLLHQISKCFYDYIHQWVLVIIGEKLPPPKGNTRKRLRNGVPKASKRKIRGEIDARFSHLPPYPDLRSFREGITLTSRWQGNEFKNMLKVYLGVVMGLVPSDVIQMIKSYLDIHRLSHYISHTESTLHMLEAAISEFERLLHDPCGTIMRLDIRPPGWHCPKIHYIRHYAAWIRQHGPLPYASTEQSESYHKAIKTAYRQSNKGPDAERFCVRDEARRFAWEVWKQQLPHAEARQMEPHQPGDSEDHVVLPKDNADVVSKTVKFLPGRRWKGLRELRIVAMDIGQPELVLETLRYIRWVMLGHQQTVRRLPGGATPYERIEIQGYLGVRMRYPTVYDDTVLIQECARCDPAWIYYQDKDWVKPRYDTVLLRYSNEEREDRVLYNKRVARLLLLFSLVTPSDGQNQELAFVQMFGISTEVDQDCGMYRVKKTTTFEVVEIATIEQGVHLIPMYQGTKNQIASSTSAPALDMYSEFWLNNQVNLHKYNSIY
jgi:hypothetical protein